MKTRIPTLLAAFVAAPLTAQVTPSEDSAQAANREIACDTRLSDAERLRANESLAHDQLETVSKPQPPGAGGIPIYYPPSLGYDITKCHPTPEDFANQVAFGIVGAELLFDRGCPSESEWSGVALDFLEDRAETSLIARIKLVGAVGRVMDCPQADQDRMRDWALRWVDIHPGADRWTRDIDRSHDDYWAAILQDDPRLIWNLRWNRYAAFKARKDTLSLDQHHIWALAPFAAQDRIQNLARRIACDIRLSLRIRRPANSLLANDTLVTEGGWRHHLGYDLMKCRHTPAAFAEMVAFGGEVQADLLFDRGCPAESEWAAAALDTLEGMARFDPRIRPRLAQAIRNRIMDCPEADRERAKKWAVEAVNATHYVERWEAPRSDTVPVPLGGKVSEEHTDSLAWMIRELKWFAEEEAVQILAREIVCDTRLPLEARQAANRLLVWDRLESVMVRMQCGLGAPPCPGWGMWLDRTDGKCKCHKGLVLTEAGHCEDPAWIDRRFSR